MKAKLIKNELPSGYFLYDEKGDLIASTIKGYKKQPLSLKNCQAIECGYDLDELAEDFWKKEFMKPGIIDKNSYKAGFQKALELLGDKKFSDEDMKNAMDRVWDWCEDDKDEDCSSMTELRNKHIQSLQQTEWEVTYNPNEKDADGCLILRRI